MNKTELFRQLAEMGTAFTPQMVQGTLGLFAPLVARPEESSVVRDVAYGPDVRHRLDIFAGNTVRNAPVLLFVHGGGFVRGDKGGPSSPFYNNIGAWATSQGFVGVTMTYRLAPANTWPAGRDDVTAAVRWLVNNISTYGGDFRRIFVMGQSAGAVHVADAVANQGNVSNDIRGALMISGIYDVESAERDDFQKAYYGTDESRYGSCSSLQKLVEARTPCLFTVSEYDPPDFQRQAHKLVDAWIKKKNCWPAMHWLRGQNHLSSVTQISSPFDSLGSLVKVFVEDNS